MLLFISLSDIFRYGWNYHLIVFFLWESCQPLLTLLTVQRICWNGTQHWLLCSYQEKHNLSRLINLTETFSLNICIIVMHHLSSSYTYYHHVIYLPDCNIVSIWLNPTCANKSKEILCISVLFMDTGVKLWCDLISSTMLPEEYRLSGPYLMQPALTFSEKI